MSFSRPWTPCLLLLLALTLASGGVGAEEISKPDAEAILERYLQGAAIDSAAALRELEVATDFYRQAGEASRHAQSLVILGMAYDAGRRHPEAIQANREAQQALAALGDSLGVMFLEVHMGDSAIRVGDFAEAEDHLARALILLQRLKASGETLSSSSMLIFILRVAGLPPQIFEGGEAGIKVFADQARPVILASFEIEILLGLMESKLGRADCAGARNVLEQAREQYERLRGSQIGWLVARTFEEQIKNVERRLADVCGMQSPRAEHPPHDAAGELADLRQRMEAAERKGDMAGLVQLLIQQASVFQLEGNFNEAAVALERSLTIARKLSDPLLHARALDNLGAHLLLWNRYEEAVTHLEQALTIYRRLGRDLDVAATQLQMGATNSVLGFHETALHQLEEARRLAREHEVFAIESEAACGVAQTYGLMGDLNKALGSLQGYRDRGNLVDQLKVRAVVTTLLVHQGKLEEAEEEASAILPTAEQMGAFAITASLEGNLAYIAWNRGQANQAFAHLDRAQEIHRANGWRYLEAATSALKAVWLYRQGQTADGIALYRQAIDLYEQIQGSLRVPDLLSGLNDEGYQFYEGFIEILAAEGKAEEAFEYSERARARALLNVLGNRRIGRAAGAPRELIDTAEELRGKLRGLEISLQSLGASSSQGDPRLEQLADTRGEYSETLRRLKLADPEYAQLVQVGTTSLDQLRHQVLADDTTLVEFFVTPRRTLAWVIDRETFKMVEIGANQDELKRRVTELRKLLDPQATRGVSRGVKPLISSTTARIQEIQESASGLYRLLITPLKPHLRHERLIIVPHDVLHYLPFAALWDAESQHYLIESHVLRYVPSASVLPHLRAKHTADRGRAMVVGDPALGQLQTLPCSGSTSAAASLQALPAARSEAKTIAKLLGTTAALGTAATESLILARAGKVDLLHLAAHGIYDECNPEFSRIELADDEANDGHLEVHELMSGVDFSGVDLVVLSACESGLGDRSNGDEIVGLSRALFYAGSPAVMATLWHIDDRATKVLMKKFYQRRKGGEPTDEALHTAQLKMLGRPRWRSPYFWAAFTLSGDP